MEYTVIETQNISVNVREKETSYLAVKVEYRDTDFVHVKTIEFLSTASDEEIQNTIVEAGRQLREEQKRNINLSGIIV